MQKANLQLSVRLSLLLAALCVVFLMIGGSAQADAPRRRPSHTSSSRVTLLWGIASANAGPDQDVRRLVADIARLSDVDAGSIFPDQVLLIPAD